eukprot:1011799-Rhodomonas_salina.1
MPSSIRLHGSGCDARSELCKASDPNLIPLPVHCLGRSWRLPTQPCAVGRFFGRRNEDAVASRQRLNVSVRHTKATFRVMPAIPTSPKCSQKYPCEKRGFFVWVFLVLLLVRLLVVVAPSVTVALNTGVVPQ